MKAFVLILLTIAVAFAVPVEVDSNEESQLTLTDLDNDQPADDNVPEVTRSKRFILKKIALAKAGVLGIGALGLAGAFASRSSGGQQQNYGPAYSYNTAPALTTAYPATPYYNSQSYGPPQTYAPPQPAYVAPQQPAYVPQPYGPPPSPFAPINAALSWKSGLVNNFARGVSSSISNTASLVGFPSPNQIQPAYSYGAPPPVAAQLGPVPNKPVYVVCDHN